MQDLELRVFGNIGQDAEIKHHNMYQIISFSVAANETWKDAAGQKHQRTTWIRCAMWRDQGQSTAIAEYLKRGQQVLVVGTPSVYAYLNQQAGKPDAQLQLKVTDLKLLGSKREEERQHVQHEPEPPAASDNDLPF